MNSNPLQSTENIIRFTGFNMEFCYCLELEDSIYLVQAADWNKAESILLTHIGVIQTCNNKSLISRIGRYWDNASYIKVVNEGCSTKYSAKFIHFELSVVKRSKLKIKRR